MKAISVILHGRVQGVFYRDWTVERARAFGLAGWVRNLPEGTVEAHLEGDAQAIRAMIAAMQEGPPRALVNAIEQSDAEVQNFSSFERR
ncbi:MAG: acylphosphatase [Erythrobacter sp.]|jgi:acylphosphatase|nr:acylphosphatase [Erythrobacter sp.]